MPQPLPGRVFLRHQIEVVGDFGQVAALLGDPRQLEARVAPRRGVVGVTGDRCDGRKLKLRLADYHPLGCRASVSRLGIAVDPLLK